MSENYFEEIKSLPLLTAEQEKELGKIIKEDGEGANEARNKLVEGNLRLVAHIANYYAGYGVDMDDLAMAGTEGLMRAAEKYDYTMETRFSTYAAYWIKQSMKREIAKIGGTIRLPDKKLYLRSEYSTVSFDKEIGDDGVVLEDFIMDENAADPCEEAISAELKENVAKALDLLEPKEALVLKMLYGIGGGEPMSLAQVAALPELKVSRERVRQIEIHAMDRLRTNYKMRAFISGYEPERGIEDRDHIEL